jgi:hypothetical protein
MAETVRGTRTYRWRSIWITALPESDARSKKHSRPDGPRHRGPLCKGRRKKSSTFTFPPLRARARPIFFPWHCVPVSLPKKSVNQRKNVSRGTDSATADSDTIATGRSRLPCHNCAALWYSAGDFPRTGTDCAGQKRRLADAENHHIT